MKIVATNVVGAYEIHMTPQTDDRGFFARSWCVRELSECGLHATFVQGSVSYNFERGTVRGMHFQRQPSTEAKLIRCTAGTIHDVLIDLRRESESHLMVMHRELTSDNHLSLFVPPGVAHGFQTLADNTEVLYQMTDYFAPELADGVRYDDPAFDIHWPVPITRISDRDRKWADYSPAGRA